MSYTKNPVTNVLTILEENHYYPFGLKHKKYNSYQYVFVPLNEIDGYDLGIDPLPERGRDEYQYKYNGKEWQDELSLNLYNYGARNYDAALGRWMNMDPLAENSIDMTPYHYTANNPIVFVDPDGMDWFYYKKEGQEEASWNWHDGSKYEHKYSYVDENGKKQNKTITLNGAEAVVVFKGSRDEKLGKGGNLFGEGAKLAEITVYGPDGADDVQTYQGFSMGSDSKKFGVIADGTYDFNYDKAGKSGKLKSHWAVENRGNVPALDGYNPNATADRRFKNGIFIHTSNQSGYAGSYNNGKNGISEGCLLVVSSLYNKEGKSTNNGWQQFNNQLEGVKRGVLQLTRD